MKYLLLVSGILFQSLFLSAQTPWAPGTNGIYYNDGNVGIGTSSPSKKLEVNTVANGDGMKIGAGVTSTESSANVYFYPSSNYSTSRNWVISTYYDNIGDFVIRSSNAQGGDPYMAGTTRFAISNNGNVGIGTTSSGSKLEVAGEIRQNGRTTYLYGANANENQALMFAGWGVAHGGIYWRGDTRTFTINTGDYADNPGQYGKANLAVTGNVLIGTTSLPASDAKLAVDGNIYSRKVKVTQSGWPDYVFHSSYRLRSLSEVEQYIQQHHHLPEVPSAEEVEKDGLDVGNNQATLLKKIEELTLYLIEQNKKLEQQQQQINELRKQISLNKQ